MHHSMTGTCGIVWADEEARERNLGAPLLERAVDLGKIFKGL